MQTQTGLENVQAVSPGMVEAGQFGYASETKTAESEEIRHSEQYVLVPSVLIQPQCLDVNWPLITKFTLLLSFIFTIIFI